MKAENTPLASLPLSFVRRPISNRRLLEEMKTCKYFSQLYLRYITLATIIVTISLIYKQLNGKFPNWYNKLRSEKSLISLNRPHCIYIYSIINFRIRCISEVLLEWKKVFQLHNVVYAKCLQTKILGLARSVNPILFSLSFNSTSINISGSMNAHRRTGRGGGEGGCSPLKFWATQIFWAARENLGKAIF